MPFCPACGAEIGPPAGWCPGDPRCPHCGSWLWCETRRRGNLLLLDVVPERPAVEEQMAGLLAELEAGPRPACIAVNLSEREVVSSSFLAGLVKLWRTAQGQGGRLVLYGLNPVVRDVFTYTRLFELFEICEDEVEAERACCGGPVSTDLVPS